MDARNQDIQIKHVFLPSSAGKAKFPVKNRGVGCELLLPLARGFFACCRDTGQPHSKQLGCALELGFFSFPSNICFPAWEVAPAISAAFCWSSCGKKSRESWGEVETNILRRRRNAECSAGTEWRSWRRILPNVDKGIWEVGEAGIGVGSRTESLL